MSAKNFIRAATSKNLIENKDAAGSTATSAAAKESKLQAPPEVEIPGSEVPSSFTVSPIHAEKQKRANPLLEKLETEKPNVPFEQKMNLFTSCVVKGECLSATLLEPEWVQFADMYFPLICEIFEAYMDFPILPVLPPEASSAAAKYEQLRLQEEQERKKADELAKKLKAARSKKGIEGDGAAGAETKAEAKPVEQPPPDEEGFLRGGGDEVNTRDVARFVSFKNTSNDGLNSRPGHMSLAAFAGFCVDFRLVPNLIDWHLLEWIYKTAELCEVVDAEHAFLPHKEQQRKNTTPFSNGQHVALTEDMQRAGPLQFGGFESDELPLYPEHVGSVIDAKGEYIRVRSLADSNLTGYYHYTILRVVLMEQVTFPPPVVTDQKNGLAGADGGDNEAGGKSGNNKTLLSSSSSSALGAATVSDGMTQHSNSTLLTNKSGLSASSPAKTTSNAMKGPVGGQLQSQQQQLTSSSPSKHKKSPKKHHHGEKKQQKTSDELDDIDLPAFLQMANPGNSPNEVERAAWWMLEAIDEWISVKTMKPRKIFWVYRDPLTLNEFYDGLSFLRMRNLPKRQDFCNHIAPCLHPSCAAEFPLKIFDSLMHRVRLIQQRLNKTNPFFTHCIWAGDITKALPSPVERVAQTLFFGMLDKFESLCKIPKKKNEPLYKPETAVFDFWNAHVNHGAVKKEFVSPREFYDAIISFGLRYYVQSEGQMELILWRVLNLTKGADEEIQMTLPMLQKVLKDAAYARDVSTRKAEQDKQFLEDHPLTAMPAFSSADLRQFVTLCERINEPKISVSKSMVVFDAYAFLECLCKIGIWYLQFECEGLQQKMYSKPTYLIEYLAFQYKLRRQEMGSITLDMYGDKQANSDAEMALTDDETELIESKKREARLRAMMASEDDNVDPAQAEKLLKASGINPASPGSKQASPKAGDRQRSNSPNPKSPAGKESTKGVSKQTDTQEQLGVNGWEVLRSSVETKLQLLKRQSSPTEKQIAQTDVLHWRRTEYLPPFKRLLRKQIFFNSYPLPQKATDITDFFRERQLGIMEPQRRAELQSQAEQHGMDKLKDSIELERALNDAQKGIYARDQGGASSTNLGGSAVAAAAQPKAAGVVAAEQANGKANHGDVNNSDEQEAAEKSVQKKRQLLQNKSERTSLQVLIQVATQKYEAQTRPTCPVCQTEKERNWGFSYCYRCSQVPWIFWNREDKPWIRRLVGDFPAYDRETTVRVAEQLAFETEAAQRKTKKKDAGRSENKEEGGEGGGNDAASTEKKTPGETTGNAEENSSSKPPGAPVVDSGTSAAPATH
ncbi:unnamed protein product [Amoebophrya sp. A120]|nr:unnamed protein product [Amoebophrya sp. A120]|eukprot:GSA120T00019093001.1